MGRKNKSRKRQDIASKVDEAQAPIASSKDKNINKEVDDLGKNATEAQKRIVVSKDELLRMIGETPATAPTRRKDAEYKNRKTNIKSSYKLNSGTTGTEIKEFIGRKLKILGYGNENMDMKFDLNEINASKNEQKATEKKTGVNELKTLFQDHEDMDHRKQKFDFDVSKVEKSIFSKGQCNIADSNVEKPENIVRLKRSVNLCFEFDESGRKKVLVDDKDHYLVDEKQKTSFEIDDGSMQLSFIGNEIFISTEEDKIDCSILKHQVIFSLTNKVTQSDPLAEGPNSIEISDCKTTAIVTDLSISDVVGTATDECAILSEETNIISDSNNILKTVSKSDSHLVTTFKQQRLQIKTERFLKNIEFLCQLFKMDFLEVLGE